MTAGCSQIKVSKNGAEKIAIIIPARLDSQRLPNKVLLEFAGLPMIEHVRRRGLLNSFSVPVYVTSGDDQILNLVESFGGTGIKTYLEHSDGLSRVNEASAKLNFHHYIILQGDEILSLPSDIDQLIREIIGSPSVEIWNQTTALSHEYELEDPSIVKCTVDTSGQIFSIFRKSPLTSNSKLQMKLISKICGLFAISKNVLVAINQKKATPLQIAESIEQLRFLEYGLRINSLSSKFNFPSINVPEDVEKVKEVLKGSPLQIQILNDVLSFTP